ncbi:MAG: RNA polymerase sigma factor [Janthinobacterium lividum]
MLLETFAPTDMDTPLTPQAPSFTIADLGQLFQKHKTHLLHFVQRYVSSWDDAEDVVQNTFVEAARSLHRFSGLSKPSTWLFGIALNLARNQVRQNGADRYDTVEEDFMEQIVDLSADPAKIFEIRQIASKVDAMLSALPQKIRSTFEAVLEGEMTYDEAAAVLRILVGTVRSRVARVRASARTECDRD